MENIDSSGHGKPQWHLLGAGSLGCLFAAYLRRAGVALELIVRDEATLEQIQANGGITLTRSIERNQQCIEHGRDNKHATTPIAAATPKTVQAPITQLLICTKAPQTPAAVAAIKPHLAPDALIVLLQNGMGVRELLQRELPHATILNALSTEGAFRNARFHITHAGRGETVIGSTDLEHQSHAKNAVRALQCDLPITFAADIEHRQWLKLAVNSVINPLTAIHHCRNGELLKLDNIDSIVTQLCDELAPVARAEHIDLSTSQLRDEIYRVMRATAANTSSMRQDIEAGRTSEIDFISGFIVQRARAHDLPCTQHERLLSAIHALEAHTSPP